MARSERRKYKRLPIKIGLSCRKVGLAGQESYRGYSVNVSPGGLYFETPASTFKQGNLLKVEMSILPTAGVLEFGGRISGFVTVLRSDNICDSHTETNLSSCRFGIALQFCQSPKLCI